MTDDTKLPECHEGEAASERFTDAMRAIFRADRAPAAEPDVNRTPARAGGPDRSASGTSRACRRPETARA
jgi:hypothetical protein